MMIEFIWDIRKCGVLLAREEERLYLAVVVGLQGGPVVPQAGTHVLCSRLFTVLVGPCDPQHGAE